MCLFTLPSHFDLKDDISLRNRFRTGSLCVVLASQPNSRKKSGNTFILKLRVCHKKFLAVKKSSLKKIPPSTQPGGVVGSLSPVQGDVSRETFRLSSLMWCVFEQSRSTPSSCVCCDVKTKQSSSSVNASNNRWSSFNQLVLKIHLNFSLSDNKYTTQVAVGDQWNDFNRPRLAAVCLLDTRFSPSSSLARHEFFSFVV